MRNPFFLGTHKIRSVMSFLWIAVLQQVFTLPTTKKLKQHEQNDKFATIIVDTGNNGAESALESHEKYTSKPNVYSCILYINLRHDS